MQERKQEHGQCCFIVINQWFIGYVRGAANACCSEIATAIGKEKSLRGSKPCAALVGKVCSDIVPL
jgi:hypothetical protein